MPRLIEAKLWIPESLDEARQVVPDIDEAQFRKWLEDGAIELRVLEVYRLAEVPGLVGAEKTIPPPYEPVKTRRLRGVAVYINDKPHIFYVPEDYLQTDDGVVTLRAMLEEYVSNICTAVLGRNVEVAFSIQDMFKLVRGERITPRSVMWEGDPDEVPAVEIELATSTAEGWWLEPGPDKSYVLKLQYVRIPPDLLPTDVEARSSFHRCGWLAKVTNIDPGFEGHVYVLLSPQPGAPPLVIEKGARVVQMRLLKLSEPLRGYSGQWKGK